MVIKRGKVAGEYRYYYIIHFAFLSNIIGVPTNLFSNNMEIFIFIQISIYNSC